MEPEQKKRIEEIMAGIECPKGFERCKHNFENLCKAKDHGLEGYVDCLEEESVRCASSHCLLAMVCFAGVRFGSMSQRN